MRKYIFYLFIIILVAACSNDNDNGDSPAPQPDINPRAMNFGTEAVTRASGSYVSGSTLPKDSSIGVFAFSQGSRTWDDMNGKTTANLMYNQKMTYTGGVALSYSPLRYWIPDSIYSFFAYYPYSATNSGHDGITIDTTNIGSGKGVGTIVYNTPTDAKNQTDLLVSDIITDRKASTSSADSIVNFRFHHALAGLRYYVDFSNSSIGLGTDTVIQSFDVTLNNIYTTGTLTTTSNNGVTTRTWTPTGIDSVKATGCTNNRDSTKGIFLLIPQTFPTNASLFVKVTTKQGSVFEMTPPARLSYLPIGTSRSVTLRPTDYASVAKKDGDSYIIWESNGNNRAGVISSANNTVIVNTPRILRNHIVDKLVAGTSKVKIDFTISGSSDCDLIVSFGQRPNYDTTPPSSTNNSHIISNNTYNVSATTTGEITIDSDALSFLKGEFYGWNDPFITLSTYNSQDQITIKTVTIIP